MARESTNGWWTVVAAAVVGWSLACSSVSGSGSPTDTAGVQDCLDEDPGGDDARIVIEATEDSYHEMVVCGGLAQRLNRSMYQVFVTSFLDAQGIQVPGGYRYDGSGHYTTGNETTTMSVAYQYGQDYTVGARGTLVEANLFELDSYLRGVTLDIDLRSRDILVYWRSTGPLVELLGRGDDPPNPLRFSVESLQEPNHLGRLLMVADVEVVDPRAEATVTYTLTTAPTRVDAVLDSGEMTFDLLSSDTVAGDGSLLTAASDGVAYNDGPGTLTGDVTFTLRGGALDVDGTYVYEDSADAELLYECL
jgi:hypothetical protein